jgi:PmbA protein
MNLDEMKRYAERTVGRARSAGAETAEASVIQKLEIEVEVRKDAIEKLTESVSNTLGITVSVDRRRASLVSSDLSDEAVGQLITEGIELARVMDRDEYFDLPDPAELGAAAADLELFHPETLRVSTEDRIALARSLERMALAMDKRIISDGCSSVSGVRTVAFANSLGFCEGFLRSSNGLFLSCAAEDRPALSENIGKKQSAGWYSTALSPRDLESPDEIAKEAVERTLRKLGARKPRTCEVPVVFDTETAGMLLESIAHAASGGNIYRKSSFLVDKVGAAIGSPLLTVIDDALLPRRLGSRPFDHEGVRSRRSLIVDAGVLKSYTLSSYQARKLGLKTTGNAGGSSNFYIEPGRSTPAEIIASVPEGLYLTSLSGPGANWSTGDFSQGAQGLWIERGDLSYPVDEFTIASTFADMLSGIELVGNDVDWRNAIASPTIKIGRITVSGT